MSNNLETLIKIIDEKTKTRRFLLLFLDILFFCPISIALSCYLLNVNWQEYEFIFLFYIIFASFFYTLSGLYRGITRFIGSGGMYKILFRNSIVTLFCIVSGNFLGLSLPNSRFWIVQWLIVSFLLGFYRFFLRDLYLKFNKLGLQNTIKKVAIYGAGAAGSQLYLSLKYSSKYKILFFIDDSQLLAGRYLHGIKVLSYESIKKEVLKINAFLIAIPSLSFRNRNLLINKLQKFCLPIYTIPSIDDLSNNKSKIDYLRPIDLEDILKRDSVDPDPALLKGSIENKVICITGGGGSIGSELCKQIVLLNPKLLIIIEKSEYNLYKIEQDLRKINNVLNIKFVLNNCSNSNYLSFLFEKYNVQVVFHAAAYKHVPIVERNPMAGIKNNVFSTLSICEASFKQSISKFLLVSSDKAVRPTNVMGASKRLSELIVQGYAEKAEKNNIKTSFSMVRFGNVLNSSGSVVPLFREQIINGGPITITHPEVIRYFMTIKEAAELMLQACTMSKGGELFLLDMGSPVKINDLAEKMIKLSGLTIKDENNKSGDIEIIFKGLRTGEKLYEELLINAEAVKSEHPLIFKAEELGISFDLLMEKLSNLKNALDCYDENNVLKITSEIVPEWKNKFNNLN